MEKVVDVELVLIKDDLGESDRIKLENERLYILVEGMPFFEAKVFYEKNVPIIKIKKVLTLAEALEVKEKLKE